jgi:phage-related protein
MRILIDPRANKEIRRNPREIRRRLKAVLDILSDKGKLEEPLAKKLTSSIFEIRIKQQGEWRVLYAYAEQQTIIVLTAFRKKTAKTPLKEITKAKTRLKEYQQ